MKLRFLCTLMLASSFAYCQTPAPEQQPPQPGQTDESKHEKAQQQLKQEEHQRILGFIPAFNTTNIPDAVALDPKQKFQLALTGALDPFVFGVDGLNAGISQAEDEFPEYGQGAKGYFKRFGAAYADSFDGAMFGNAVFPILLHQDPRYFRKGTGSIKSRIWYAVQSTWWSKNDNGKWGFNYSNILGNLAAGGISNLYYPASERGAGLTIQRAVVVSAEGAFGALGYEFWPDVQRILRNHRERKAAEKAAATRSE